MSNEIINPRLVYVAEIRKIREVKHPEPNKAVKRANPGIKYDGAVSLLLISESFYNEDNPTRLFDTAELDEETNIVHPSMFFEILVAGSGFTYSSPTDIDRDCRNLRSATLHLKNQGEVYFNFASASVNPIYLHLASEEIYLKNRKDGVPRRHGSPEKDGRLLWNLKEAEILRVSGRTADLSSVVLTPSLVAA